MGCASLQQGLLPLSMESEICRGGYRFDSFPVVFGSTKIGIAAVNRNLKQCSSSHQFHLRLTNTWPQLTFKMVTKLCCITTGDEPLLKKGFVQLLKPYKYSANVMLVFIT